MQQEKNRKYYDVIVIGASVPGVFFAIEQKKLGNDVLLINKYGFPGGYLTESLSILQMLERNSLFPEIENWLSDLEEDNGLLFQASTTNIFNPENVKISLQKLLQKT